MTGQNSDSVQNHMAVFEAPPKVTLPSSLRDTVLDLIEASMATATRKAYGVQWRLFETWCASQGFSPFPADPAVLAGYVGTLAQREVSCSTVNKALAAIAAVHRGKGLSSPTDDPRVKRVVRGYRRQHGTAAQHKAAAATYDILQLLLKALRENGDSLRNYRDAALLSLGYAGAFRRSELISLDLIDLSWEIHDGEEVCIVRLRRSKTDQEGRGMVKAIFPGDEAESCPVRLLKRWLDVRGRSDGPLFVRIRKGGQLQTTRLTAQSVRDEMLRAKQLAGLAMPLSAHSLRSGFVTNCVRQGWSERSVMNQTGHRSSATLREYFQRQSVVEDNAARGACRRGQGS